MAYEARFAGLAAMIADPSRARMLSYLLDGHYASAGELAKAASVSAATASGHLNKLRHAGLVAMQQRGRHHYFKIADADVAHALEALALVGERGSHERLWNGGNRSALRYARRCYGHLAGELGVALLRSLLANGHLEADAHGYRLTADGERWLRSIGLDPPRARTSQRLAYPCLDWSERRDHLAGDLATSLLDHFVARRWLTPNAVQRASLGGPQHRRALRLTRAGELELLPHISKPKPEY